MALLTVTTLMPTHGGTVPHFHAAMCTACMVFLVDIESTTTRIDDLHTDTLPYPPTGRVGCSADPESGLRASREGAPSGSASEHPGSTWCTGSLHQAGTTSVHTDRLTRRVARKQRLFMLRWCPAGP